MYNVHVCTHTSVCAYMYMHTCACVEGGIEVGWVGKEMQELQYELTVFFKPNWVHDNIHEIFNLIKVSTSAPFILNQVAYPV